jgi:hypothetical protein
MNRYCIIVFVLASMLCPGLMAQSSDENKGEFFVGYALNRMHYRKAMEDAIGSETNTKWLNLNGFNVAVDHDIYYSGTTGSLGIAVDFGGFFGKIREFSDEDVRIWTVTAGPQFTARQFKALQPFVRGLFGFSYIDGNLGGGISDDPGFSFLLGGGLDAKVSKDAHIRLIQIDYQGMHHDSVLIDNWRFAAGVTFPF